MKDDGPSCCGCIVLLLAIVGFLYLIGALT